MHSSSTDLSFRSSSNLLFFACNFSVTIIFEGYVLADGAANAPHCRGAWARSDFSLAPGACVPELLVLQSAF
jgi:hypothetical protein